MRLNKNYGAETLGYKHLDYKKRCHILAFWKEGIHKKKLALINRPSAVNKQKPCFYKNQAWLLGI